MSELTGMAGGDSSGPRRLVRFIQALWAIPSSRLAIAYTLVAGYLLVLAGFGVVFILDGDVNRLPHYRVIRSILPPPAWGAVFFGTAVLALCLLWLRSKWTALALFAGFSELGIVAVLSTLSWSSDRPATPILAVMITAVEVFGVIGGLALVRHEEDIADGTVDPA